MHAAAFSYIAEHIPPGTTTVLEFGARNINGTVRTLLPGVAFTGVDIIDGNGVDIVHDAATLNLKDRFELVVCAEVFEHAGDEACAGMCRAAFKHLVKGGTFIVTAAGPEREPHSAMDGAALQNGEFYRNITQELLESWLSAARWMSWDVDTAGADLRCVATR